MMKLRFTIPSFPIVDDAFQVPLGSVKEKAESCLAQDYR